MLSQRLTLLLVFSLVLLEFGRGKSSRNEEQKGDPPPPPPPPTLRIKASTVPAAPRPTTCTAPSPPTTLPSYWIASMEMGVLQTGGGSQQGCLGGEFVMSYDVASLPWRFDSLCVALVNADSSSSYRGDGAINVTVSAVVYTSDKDFEYDDRFINEDDAFWPVHKLYESPLVVREILPFSTLPRQFVNIPLSFTTYSPRVFIGVHVVATEGFCGQAAVVTYSSDSECLWPALHQYNYLAGLQGSWGWTAGTCAYQMEVSGGPATTTPSILGAIPHWSCPIANWADKQVCNLNCGLMDPDCIDLSATRKRSKIPDDGCPNGTTLMKEKWCVPNGWTTDCPGGINSWDSQNGCQCGCGGVGIRYDPDCDWDSNGFSCLSGANMNSTYVLCSSTNQCIRPYTVDTIYTTPDCQTNKEYRIVAMQNLVQDCSYMPCTAGVIRTCQVNPLSLLNRVNISEWVYVMLFTSGGDSDCSDSPSEVRAYRKGCWGSGQGVSCNEATLRLVEWANDNCTGSFRPLYGLTDLPAAIGCWDVSSLGMSGRLGTSVCQSKAITDIRSYGAPSSKVIIPVWLAGLMSIWIFA